MSEHRESCVCSGCTSLRHPDVLGVLEKLKREVERLRSEVGEREEEAASAWDFVERAERLFDERNEARAEVERLRAAIRTFHGELVDAYPSGSKAFRDLFDVLVEK